MSAPCHPAPNPPAPPLHSTLAAASHNAASNHTSGKINASSSHSAPSNAPHIVIVGAGWAGCAAAVRAVQNGAKVTLLEASRTLGGRARSMDLATAPAGALDNGQHIMLAAYTDTLALMRTLGACPETLLQRLPLDLRTPDGCGLALQPSQHPRLATFCAILRAQGWSWRDKASLLLAAARWQLQRFHCAPEVSVQTLCRHISPRVHTSLIEPLCIAAFNSKPAHTSAAVFLRVLRDALLLHPNHADALIARTPIGQILPEPAHNWLQQAGATVLTGQRVLAISPQAPTTIATTTAATACNNSDTPNWRVHCNNLPNAISANHIILACPAWEAARLVQHWLDTHPAPNHYTSHNANQATARHWAQQAAALHHNPIATVYAWCATTACQHLPPMQALHCHSPEQAQFVFHHPQHQRQSENGQQQTLLAFVASTCSLERPALQAAILAQAAQQLGLHGLQAIQTTIEKRATFLCSPALPRPAPHIAKGLLACGDYIQGPYPATLEGAVRSGLQAAHIATNCPNSSKNNNNS